MNQDTGKDLTRSREDSGLVSEIDIQTATKILLEIVNTDHETLRELPSTIGPYTVGQIRQAMLVVSNSLIARAGRRIGLFEGVLKQEGGMNLSLTYHDDSTYILHMSLRSASGDQLFIRNSFPYDDKGTIDWSSSEFGDYRFSQTRRARLDGRYDVLEPTRAGSPNLEEAKLLFLGLRWQAANMLFWELPLIILPEQLPGGLKKLPRLSLPTLTK